MANCPKCGAPATGKFCASCGAPVPQDQVAAAPMPNPPPPNYPPQPSMPPQAPVQPGYPPQPQGYPPQPPGYQPQPPGYHAGYPQPGFAPAQPKKINWLLWVGVGIGLGLLIVVLVLMLEGSGGPGNTIGPVVITDVVDPTTQKPGSKLTKVPATTNPIYAAMEVTTDKPTELLAKWYIDGEHVPAVDTRIELAADYQGWMSFQLTSQGIFPTGTYTIEVYRDGQFFQTHSFEVE